MKEIVHFLLTTMYHLFDPKASDCDEMGGSIFLWQLMTIIRNDVH